MKSKTLTFVTLLLCSNMTLAQEMSLAEGAMETAGTLQTAGTTGVAPVAPLYEASCKIKAKEAAAAIFRSCMSDGKNAQLEHIRKEYQEKLGQMRTEYEKELSRLSKLKKEKETEKASERTSDKSSFKAKASTNKLAKSSSKPQEKSVVVKTKTVQVTKKGLPLKTTKTVVSETLNNGTTDATDTMTVSLKSSKDMVFEEGQDIPEPISIEPLETINTDTATIQLD